MIKVKCTHCGKKNYIRRKPKDAIRFLKACKKCGKPVKFDLR